MSIKKSKMAAIAVNKSLLKEYMTKESPNDSETTVYLNDGDEFQIQLFNPTTDVIGAEISINSDKLSGLIVLKPGERIWLERYLDTARKFKFSTYEVDGNDSEVAEAIKNNGEVKVQFYKEKKRKDNFIRIVTEPWNGYCKPDVVLTNTTNPDKNWSDITFGSTCQISGAINTANDCKSTTNALYSSGIDTMKSFSSVVNSLDCLTTSCAVGMDNNYDTTLKMSAAENKIETGRIDEGSYSNQNFKTVDNDFESWTFMTAVFKILPVSRKPYSSSDLQKVYCTECGRKLNPKYKFCPYCGAKVELLNE